MQNYVLKFVSLEVHVPISRIVLGGGCLCHLPLYSYIFFAILVALITDFAFYKIIKS